jgi:hypothetical protein
MQSLTHMVVLIISVDVDSCRWNAVVIYCRNDIV